ncbi:MAG: AbrB/MazE/SpoVT family DNA-binding domain-containing protein [Neomegalonema sp.]|nr:AbrB/MazE/SpoVT family DNA-binding domain-containing protein [Neomegalonema sp.]
MSQATLGQNWQITLPADVRRALAIEPGDTVRFSIAETGEVTLISSTTLAKTRRPSGAPDRPTPHGARAPIDFPPTDASDPAKPTAARGVAALRSGPTTTRNGESNAKDLPE